MTSDAVTPPASAAPFAHIRSLPLETPTLPPATHTNTYVVGSGQAVLIEPATPLPEEQGRLLAWVRELRSEGLEITALLLTHHHPDHIGAVDVVREELMVPVLAHESTVARLAGTVTLDGTIADEEVFELEGPTRLRLRAIHTPGHAPGHLCFIEEQSGAMVAGDMVAGVGSILIEPVDGDMTLYLESLERMRGFCPTALLPAHGPALPDADAVLVHYGNHRRMRERAIADVLRRVGPCTPSELVHEVYRDVPRDVWPLAEQSTIAHLIKLERDGRARERKDGFWVLL